MTTGPSASDAPRRELSHLHGRSSKRMRLLVRPHEAAMDKRHDGRMPTVRQLIADTGGQTTAYGHSHVAAESGRAINVVAPVVQVSTPETSDNTTMAANFALSLTNRTIGSILTALSLAM